MKKSVVFIIAFLAICTSASVSNSARYWAKTYGGNSVDRPYSIQQTSDGGYIVAGETHSFGDEYGDIWVIKLDSSGNISWQKTYGGSNHDYANSIQQTSDGGYVVVGYITPELEERAGVLKLDSNGDIIWQKTYQTGGESVGGYLQQTEDGGYILTGSFYPNGSFGILKLDGVGNVMWLKTYGSFPYDWFHSIQRTSDGGYVVAGFNRSLGAGDNDIWVLKLDTSGDVVWQKTYGGSDSDVAWEIQQTLDDGYIIVGETTISFGAGNEDALLVRLDSNGNFIWGKTYGGAGHDLARSVQQETDGSFIVLGRLWPTGEYSSIWLSNLDSNGNIIWQKTYEGYHADAISIKKTADGGHIIAGEKNVADFFILKLDRDDNIFDCDIQGTGDVIVHDAPIVSQNTNVSVQSPTVTVDNTHITPYDTSAVINTYCYYNSEDCEGNFDCDADVDGSDAALFKADFGRSTISEPRTNQKPCNGDFNCDGDCDGTDASRFKQDFGRSSIQNPCPACVVGDWCNY